MPRRCYYFCSIVFFALAGVWGVAQPTPEELQQQQQRFEAMRKHPEQLARLRRDLQAFQAAPPERRKRIIKLDQEIHGESSKDQARLWNVLERYVDWLERLAEEDRQAIKQAPDRTARLALIRGLRDREWMLTQPKARQEEFKKLTADAKGSFVKDLRAKEKERQEQWQLAARFWRELESKKAMPTRLADFADKSSDRVPRYVNDYLLPMLSDGEKKQLAAAEGKWPDYPRTLVRIARKHPSALPPPPPLDTPTRVSQLPRAIQAKVTTMTTDKKGNQTLKMIKGLQQYEKQPSFAGKVVEFGTKKGAQPFEFEFWACNYRALHQPMRDFVETKLKPMLNNVEKAGLQKVEGSWPSFPAEIQKLSDKYSLTPPWHILPDPEKWKWDHYLKPDRSVEGFPATPKMHLRDFALFELDEADLARLNLSAEDPQSIPRLVQAYYTRYPQELQRLQAIDRRKRADRFQTLSVPLAGKTKPGT